VPAGDAPALAAALGEVLSLGATQAEALRMRARAHVENMFSLERMVADTLDVYAALIEARSPHRRG